MAKKSKTIGTGITKKRNNTSSLLGNFPKDHGEWLELVIRLTERAIDRAGGNSPSMIQQHKSLKKELAQWRKENA